MSANRLCLNTDKTELIWTGAKSKLGVFPVVVYTSKAVFTLRATSYDIGRRRTTSYDVVRCRNDTDAETELGSISAPMSYDVVRHRHIARRPTPARHGNLHVKIVGRHRTTSDDVVVSSGVVPSDVVRHRASRHPALSYDVMRSVNTA